MDRALGQEEVAKVFTVNSPYTASNLTTKHIYNITCYTGATAVAAATTTVNVTRVFNPF